MGTPCVTPADTTATIVVQYRDHKMELCRTCNEEEKAGAKTHGRGRKKSARGRAEEKHGEMFARESTRQHVNAKVA